MGELGKDGPAWHCPQGHDVGLSNKKTCMQFDSTFITRETLFLLVKRDFPPITDSYCGNNECICLYHSENYQASVHWCSNIVCVLRC